MQSVPLLLVCNCEIGICCLYYYLANILKRTSKYQHWKVGYSLSKYILGVKIPISNDVGMPYILDHNTPLLLDSGISAHCGNQWFFTFELCWLGRVLWKVPCVWFKDGNAKYNVCVTTWDFETLGKKWKGKVRWDKKVITSLVYALDKILSFPKTGSVICWGKKRVHCFQVPNLKTC